MFWDNAQSLDLRRWNLHKRKYAPSTSIYFLDNDQICENQINACLITLNTNFDSQIVKQLPKTRSVKPCCSLFCWYLILLCLRHNQTCIINQIYKFQQQGVWWFDDNFKLSNIIGIPTDWEVSWCVISFFFLLLPK